MCSSDLPAPSAPRWVRHSYLSKVLRYTPYTCGSSARQPSSTPHNDRDPPGDGHPCWWTTFQKPINREKFRKCIFGRNHQITGVCQRSPGVGPTAIRRVGGAGPLPGEPLMTTSIGGCIVVLSINKSVEPNEEQKVLTSSFDEGFTVNTSKQVCRGF